MICLLDNLSNKIMSFYWCNSLNLLQIRFEIKNEVLDKKIFKMRISMIGARFGARSNVQGFYFLLHLIERLMTDS